MTSRLRVLKSGFFRILHLYGPNSQMAELFIAWIKTISVDRSGMKCSGCAVKQVNSVSCCTVARWQRLSEWFWLLFFFFLILCFFLPLTPIAWHPCQGATASNQIIYHSSGEVFPKTAINYLRALAPNAHIVFPADVVTLRGDSPHASLPLSARASAAFCLHLCAWVNNNPAAPSSSLWFCFFDFLLLRILHPLHTYQNSSLPIYYLAQSIKVLDSKN